MFFHAVLMELSDTSPEFIAQVDSYTDRVRAELPYVRNYHFGPNVASRAGQYRWVVIATFDTEADHERYQVSEVHTQMKRFMGPHIADIVVCDVDTSEMENRDV